MWMDFVDPGLIFCITLAFDIIIFLVSISFPDHPHIVQKLTAEDHTARIYYECIVLKTYSPHIRPPNIFVVNSLK